MSDDIKRSLRAELDREVIARPQRDLSAVMQRGQRKRAINWIAAGTTAVIVIAGVGLIARDLADNSPKLQPGREGSQNDDRGSSPLLLGNGCPRSKGNLPSNKWTSPTTFVAGGDNDGVRWVLCARTVEQTKGPDAGTEGLCDNWLYGDGPGSGMNCFFSDGPEGPVALDESYFFATSGPESGYFFGAVPAAARSVELDTSSGTRIVGNIHPAPDKLEVPFQFFTLFAEPFAEGTLIVRDADGDVIRRRVMEHGLSQLVVTKEGTGEGTVTGYRTIELLFHETCEAEGKNTCREPRPVWIECGNDCDAALDDARITLVAEPAEGSRFVGWSGACSGTGDCELVVDENLTVTATFEPSS